jgi:hypothetical protein
MNIYALRSMIRIGLLTALTALVLFGLQGCAGPDLKRYQAEQPALDLKTYFNGDITGWGMVLDRSGEVSRRFVVRIKASWNGDEGILDEYFDWSDGEKQRRVWTLKAVGPNRYIGTADDVVGEAIGEIYGNALHWRYRMSLPFRDGTVELDFDDWMFLIDNQVMLNRAVFSKFGIRLGEVILSFSK